MINQINISDIDPLANYQQAVEENRQRRVSFPVGSQKEQYFYKPTTILLGVLKANGKSEEKLVIVQREDITCVNLFLRYFGRGKLAHTSFSLKTVAGYLGKFDWTGIKDKKDEDRSLLAFKGVCSIANRWARHSPSREGQLDGETTLLKHLSEEKTIKDFSFQINSQTEVCDIGNQIRRSIDERARNSFLAAQTTSIWLKGLDRDNRLVDRYVVPVTRLQLKDGSILSSHDLVPKDLNAIDKVQFIFRIQPSSAQAQQELHDMVEIHLPKDLSVVVHERYTTNKTS
jgi:hypothetical protein